MKAEWMHRYKRKVIISILAILTASIILTMFFIAGTLRSRLIDESKASTLELSEVIGSSLGHLMMARNSARIQETLERISSGESPVMKAFILNTAGEVVYSSDRSIMGNAFDRFGDSTCNPCHTAPGAIPGYTTMILKEDGRKLLRNVNIIQNEEACHGCHSRDNRINGKLIIDRSLDSTYSLIANIEFILLLSGGFCLIILVPVLSRLLSRGMNTYISEVDLRSTELSMLYMIVERLSKSIDFDELKLIVIDMIREFFGPDEVHIIIPRDSSGYGGVVWRKSDGRIERRDARGEDPCRQVVDRWFSGGLENIERSEDGKQVVIPVLKTNVRLALIIIRKQSGHVDVGLNLMNAMGSHIAVAFENASLYSIAITDELTGLYNNRHFRSMIEKKFDLFQHYGEKLTLLMIDIDNFKRINDTYGHVAGDKVLKDVSHRTMHSIREQDLGFRYGGEEFAVILPSSDLEAGTLVAERIREAVAAQTFKSLDIDIMVTVSIGIASCPENALTIRDLVVEADQSLYQAKRTGKNKVVISIASPEK